MRRRAVTAPAAAALAALALLHAEPALLLAEPALFLAAPAHANSGGIVGRSGKTNQTCNACHSGGTRPTVSFAAPAAVAPSSTATLTFSVQAPNPGQRAAGFNVAVEDGGGGLAIVAGQGERLSGGELTHTEPKDNDAARVASWEFLWTAPAAAGRYRLFGAGNSVNRNGQNSGDRSRTTTFDIDVVESATTPTPTPTSPPSPTPSATASLPPTATASPLPTTPPSPSPTQPVPPSATATPTQLVSDCAGDCDGDGTVAINELISGVAIALGAQPLAACAVFDLNADGAVAINELIAGVNNALNACAA
jgi:hypothetical protein